MWELMVKNDFLVAIMNDLADFEIAKNKHWYRIPVTSVTRLLNDSDFPPRYVGFYQTKIFGNDAYSINYYAEVLDIKRVSRKRLFPNEQPNSKSKKFYHKMILSPLCKINNPISSRSLRRIVFIPTTYQKFISAEEINDLFNQSPLEDRIWELMKKHKIIAERQDYFAVNEHIYQLDFSIYCNNGAINVETDGDTWHSNSRQAVIDNRRDNNLVSAGWKILRFSGTQIKECGVEYCIKTIKHTISNMGGLSENITARKSLHSFNEE